MHRISLLVAVLSVFVLATGPAASEDGDVAEYIRAHYTKFEYRIPMRDGVELFTLAFVPNDASDQRTYPMLLARSPYSVGPYGVDRYPESFFLPEEMVREGFIFVEQDVRGRFLSDGEFVNMRPHREDKKGPDDIDESTDTYDTVEWLVSQIEHTNGRVGIWGNSYLGFYTSAGIIDTHPAIKAAMPSAPIADWYFDDMHHHGALSLNMTFNFFSSFGVVREGLTTEWPERFDHETPDGYQFFLDLGPLSNVNERYFHHEIPFWEAVVSHPDYDEFWKARDILPHLKQVSCAVLTIGGLFDAEDLYGAWHTYGSIEELSWAPGPTARGFAMTDRRWVGPTSALPPAVTSVSGCSCPFFCTTSRTGNRRISPKPWSSKQVPTGGARLTGGPRLRWNGRPCIWEGRGVLGGSPGRLRVRLSASSSAIRPSRCPIPPRLRPDGTRTT